MILKEFKEFASKGNAMDMAVGVIIGGAFQKIVSSLVEDIIMPTISILSCISQSATRVIQRPILPNPLIKILIFSILLHNSLNKVKL